MSRPTRRHLLAAGASVAAASAAGCTFDFDFDLGDTPEDDPADAEPDDEQADPEDDESVTEMGLTTVEYTTDRATGFGEYTTQPDAAYDIDTMVWLYIELENVTPREGPELDTEWTVTGPTGEEVASVSDSVAVDRLEPLPNEAFLTQGLNADVFAGPPGEYTLTVRVEDIDSGVERVATTTFTLVGFGFYTVTMTDGEPQDIDQYDEQTTPYERGDQVWVYIETAGHEVDDTDTARLTYDIAVTDPDGNTWATAEDEEVWDNAAGLYLAVWQGFETEADDAAGEYTVDVSVKDVIGGTTIDEQTTFEIAA